MLLEFASAISKDMPSASSAKKKDSPFLNLILLSSPSIQNKVNEIVVSIITDDNGHSKIVDGLASHGFILDSECVNESLLLTATEKNYSKFIENILSNSTDLSDAKFSPLLLHTAVTNGHVATVKLFLNTGFDASIKDRRGKASICYALHCKEEGKCVEILELLFASGANIKEAPELLHAAISAKFVEVCKVLIKNGADVNALNSDGNAPLHLIFPINTFLPFFYYVQKQDDEKNKKEAEMIKLLLKSGAVISIKARDGFTALHDAVKNGRKDLIYVFLNFGVDINLCAEDGSTPLHSASESGYKEIVNILCKNEANVNALKKDGTTPLHCAAFVHLTVVEILLDNGSDINLETNDGSTALDNAILGAKAEYADFERRLQRENRVQAVWEQCPNSPSMDSALFDYESSGDDEDYIDRDFNPDDFDVFVTLKRHLIKLDAGGLYVSEKNLRLLKDLDREHSEFQRKCKKEINRMKNNVLQAPFTLYNTLVNGESSNYIRNSSLMLILDSFDFQEFPIYEPLLIHNFQKNKLRLTLLISGQKSLKILIKSSIKLNDEALVLPVELLEEIVLYLNNHELKNFIRCVVRRP